MSRPHRHLTTTRGAWIARGRRWSLPAVAFLFGLLIACGADRPLVERFDEGHWRPDPFTVASMGGQRAGATITFVLRLEAPAERRLVVEGTVEINPQATLLGGTWVEEGGAGPRSGDLSAATLDFFGGQGDRPSLGGRFTLSADREGVYRVNLPPTVLTAER